MIMKIIITMIIIPNITISNNNDKRKTYTNTHTPLPYTPTTTHSRFSLKRVVNFPFHYSLVLPREFLPTGEDGK